ncbi:MAG: 4Fe-4S binding protein [Coriobacteriia bacterium]|nr:4Fe-4S binding protein [Coriobacteriia bacterium]
MAQVTVDSFYCKGCGLCVAFCPKNIMALNLAEISQKGYHPAVCTKQEICNGCLSCALMCPDSAIKIER